VSDAAWPRLAAPFGGDVVAWLPVELADGGEEVRVVPLVAAAALRARFDQVLGIAGWSVAYAPLDAGAVACHVTVAGVTKGAVAPAALVGGPAAAADAAFAHAAAAFGLRPPFPAGTTAWVPCDPETLLPLHPPTVEPTPAVEASPAVEATADDAVAADAPSAAAAVGPAHAAAPGAVRPGGAPDAVRVGAAAAGAVAPPAPPAEKPTGQQMIDRLVERLKDEGQGLAAARLLVRYGGYGKDPDTARELYAQLRALLRSAPAATVGSAGGGA
jgi:hypothetical protein